MRISRVYIDQSLAPDTAIELSGQTAHYLGKVLRLTVDSAVILFNGDGYEYSACITSLTKKHLELQVNAIITPVTESSLHIILGIGISRGERMDYAVQKSTELGVSEIVPLFTEHGEVKLKGDRIEKRQAHWQQVAISACEQSGRVIVPVVHRPLNLSEWINSAEAADCSQKLIFDHTQSQALTTDKPEGKVAVLIGSEGGFSERELAQTRQNGFTGIKLGPRILRTETAPVAVLSVLQYVWGDF